MPNISITPCLWCDDRIEDQVKFYLQVFGKGEITSTQRYPDGRPLVMEYQIENQKFMALNGGPQFKYTEAVSFYVFCDTQAEVDHFWNSLTADGGAESMCGWLKDKYGLSWQIVPRGMLEIFKTDKTGRSMQAMMKMKKIVLADIEKAAKG